MTESVTSKDVLDVVKVVFVAFAPPAISFIGAAAGAYAIDSLIHATTRQELVEGLILFMLSWLLIPALQAAVASSAMQLSIHSKRAMRLAPWLLAIGFIVSLISIQFYDTFLGAFKEGWRQLTAFITFTPMIATYIIAASRLIVD
jgi:hypothetical protein